MHAALRNCVLALAALALTTGLSAEPMLDLSIRTETDEDRHTIYLLANRGDRSIRAIVEFKKTCSGQSNKDKPQQRTVWVQPHKTTKLGRSGVNSSCRHHYRILEAEYLGS